jgi:hypothetical protein
MPVSTPLPSPCVLPVRCAPSLTSTTADLCHRLSPKFPSKNACVLCTASDAQAHTKAVTVSNASSDATKCEAGHDEKRRAFERMGIHEVALQPRSKQEDCKELQNAPQRATLHPCREGSPPPAKPSHPLQRLSSPAQTSLLPLHWHLRLSYVMLSCSL